MECQSLLHRIREQSQHALRAGALLPIETEAQTVVDGDIPFVVRRVSSLARKDAMRLPGRDGHQPGGDNPFLPYDPELLVADLSPSHVCLLNKFNVLDEHVLVVTRSFVDQDRLLDPSDFDALHRVIAEVDGLGFYNGGRIAGASQPHKHLQMVASPLAPTGASIPIGPLVESSTYGIRAPTRNAALPFKHSLLRLPQEVSADYLYESYVRLLDAVDIRSVPKAGGPTPSSPYNLLVTRRWMLAVPRSAEHAGEISVNALGFAGSLFVRSIAQMQLVMHSGPLAILAAVGVPCR